MIAHSTLHVFVCPSCFFQPGAKAFRKERIAAGKTKSCILRQWRIGFLYSVEPGFCVFAFENSRG